MHYTDRYSFAKRRTSSNKDQNVLIWGRKYASYAREIFHCGQKNVYLPNPGCDRFSGKKENQLISVINTFFPRSFNTILNDKKLDFYILKGLD